MAIAGVAAPRVVVAGTGHGLRVHVPALRSAGFEVVALVGSDSERTRRRAEKAGIQHASTDLAEAITQTRADCVVVATTPPSHAPLVRVALAHRCHVLCEKPFVQNAGQARELLAAAEEAGVVHLLGNQFRMLPERAMIGRAIADGAIGAPRLVTITQYAGLLADTSRKWPDWWFDREAGGGWLGSSGSHMIDMIRSWLGEFESLSASTLVVADRSGASEDSYTVRFEMTNGVQGLLAQTGGAWGPFASMTRVAGSKGTVWLEDGAAWLADKDSTSKLPIPDALVLPPESPSDDPRQQFLHVELPPARRLCEIWRALIEGRPFDGPPPATFADGLACMKVIDAIHASAAQGGARIAIVPD
ncbi:Gfo/Idh/MocA family protein [Sphingomonas sp. LaA6.9]|uniref:Gfo/Idh/MocA family protein n=1 Tax=Sphingomonas sp. LaA6.9 TaxID=2919914 RepID=UPI001F501507|nr:Gfo/Idh/MocA family oxidoreductase [Sphingomonas sp. LaA6.9]MCJ8158554.1 Gfo/Idh/MocA family oxidoreductase [Sphingomonas sp. LaA6.9]